MNRASSLVVLLFIILPLFSQETQIPQKEVPCKVEILQELEQKCHDDEDKVTDINGGTKCVKKKNNKSKIMQWNAKDCIRDFKPKDDATITVPLDYFGNPNFSNATLEGFDFKLVCPIIKAKEDE